MPVAASMARKALREKEKNQARRVRGPRDAVGEYACRGNAAPLRWESLLFVATTPELRSTGKLFSAAGCSLVTAGDTRIGEKLHRANVRKSHVTRYHQREGKRRWIENLFPRKSFGHFASRIWHRGVLHFFCLFVFSAVRAASGASRSRNCPDHRREEIELVGMGRVELPTNGLGIVFIQFG